MKISLQATQLELSQSIKIYVDQRLSPLEKFIQSFEKDRQLTLKVEVARTTHHHKKGDNVYYVECTMELPNKKMIRIEQYGPDLRKAIDQARARLKTAMESFKDQAQEKKSKRK